MIILSQTKKTLILKTNSHYFYKSRAKLLLKFIITNNPKTKKFSLYLYKHKENN